MSRSPAWYLYWIRCGDGTIYTGISNDVPRRLAEHRAGKGARYLRGRGPLVLERKMRVGSRSHALKVELRVKRLPRFKKEKLIKGKLRLKALIEQDVRRQTLDVSKKKDSRTRKQALNNQ